MNNEEVVKDLEIKDDIYNLSSDRLISKYGNNRDKLSKFLKKLSTMFTDSSVFPVMILGEYSKIENFLYRSYYFNNIELAPFYSHIYNNMKININRNYDYDDIGQAEYIFKGIVGYNKVKEGYESTREIIKGMLECARNLSGEVNISKSEIQDYLNKKVKVKSCETITDSLNNFNANHTGIHTYVNKQHINCLFSQFKLFDYNMAYNDYRKFNPNISLCYNLNFLFLANYMMTSHKEYCDEHFINLVKEIIDISISFDELKPSRFDKKNYLRVAKFTLRNINKLLEHNKVKKKWLK